MLSLGVETLAPYARADDKGEPMFRLDDATARSVPFLSYGAGAYLGRLVEVIAKQADAPLKLDAIYETDMAEGLKAMAIEGHGLAFLPASSVKKEVKSAPPGARLHDRTTRTDDGDSHLSRSAGSDAGPQARGAGAVGVSERADLTLRNAPRRYRVRDGRACGPASADLPRVRESPA